MKIIDTKNYILIDPEGYDTKEEAYEWIRALYSHLLGVTTYYGSDGKWYIVQSKALANL